MNFQPGIEYSSLSDVGMRRKTNQDSFSAIVAPDESAWRQRGHLFLVADGMGAHAAGELASKLASDHVPHLYRKMLEQYSTPEALERAIVETNAEVHRRGQANLDFYSMGTTASVLVLVPQGAIIAQVGDSRIYRLRGSQLDQLTFDHSLVWEMRNSGQLPADTDVSHMVPKNIITRCLGPQPTVQVDIEGPFPLEAGDTFLLCSDGLTGQVRDEELGPILANLPPKEAAQVLIDLANLRGGPDNITAIVVRVTDPSMVANAQHEPPIRVGLDPRPQKIPLPVWIVMGVCLLGALVLLIVQKPLAALAACIASGLALGGGWLHKARILSGGVSLRDGRKLGRAPYVSVSCSSLHEFVLKLTSVVRALQEVARANQWPINWQPFDEHCRQAEAAAKENRHAEALRSYALAMSTMMRELRTGKAPTNDSALD